MTVEKYYAALEKRWAVVNKDSLSEIRAYNEWRRQLRHLLEKEAEK